WLTSQSVFIVYEPEKWGSLSTRDTSRYQGEKIIMKIGHVAKATGLSIKSIRYYHDIGLVKGQRGANGYREYAPSHVEALSFIHHCRSLGFTLDDCRALLDLKMNQSRHAEDVKVLAKQHLTTISDKIRQLQILEQQLKHLIHDCEGGEQANCAILTGLSQEISATDQLQKTKKPT
ncbi:MerR family DNA-binding protein, partial [uncultured Shewanella sp.]|uniref:MerR family DNA-binding protein n=1 Tax=uncultured Shewanella sp. TaxID=173975 RepID=UPI0026071F79